MNPLEAILRHCAQAAPHPWYPSVFARETGTPRDSLDPHLDRLRMGGLIQLTEWMEDKGQGYVLTPEGEALLQSPRQLSRLGSGQLPPTRAQVAEDVQEEMVLPGESMRQALLATSRPRVTTWLIYLNIAVFLAGLFLAWRKGAVEEYMARSTPEALNLTGALYGPAVFLDGQWWRLLTACFVHIGLLHLAMNMFSLYMVGRPVEQMLGSGWFLLLYLLSGLCGSCGMLIENPLGGGAGASGAIWGVMSALLALVVAYRSALPPRVYLQVRSQLVMVILLNVYLTFSVANISKGGHFGGGIAGLLLAIPIDYMRVGRGLQRAFGLLFTIAVPVLAFALVFRTVDRTPELERRAREIEQERFSRSYLQRIDDTSNSAIKSYQKSLQLLNTNAQRRAPAEVEQTVKEFQERRDELHQVIDSLMQRDPFTQPRVEKQRQVAIEYLQALDELLEMTVACLRAGPDCTLRDENRRTEQEKKTRELQDRLLQSFSE